MAQSSISTDPPLRVPPGPPPVPPADVGQDVRSGALSSGALPSGEGSAVPDVPVNRGVAQPGVRPQSQSSPQPQPGPAPQPSPQPQSRSQLGARPSQPAAVKRGPIPKQPVAVGAGISGSSSRSGRWRDDASVHPNGATDLGMGLPGKSPDSGEDESGLDYLEVEKSAPAWLISLVIHLVALLLLALLSLPQTAGVGRLLIELGESEEAEEVELTQFSLEGAETPEIVAEAEMDALEPMVVVEADVPMEITELIVPSEIGALQIQANLASSLSGRTGAMKNALLAASGGTKATQDAVELGLQWLKKNQNARGGFWSLTGPYTDGSSSENKPAATAMAMLAFQGDGNTHLSGPYQEQVAKGMKWLLGQQDREGSFVTKSRPPGHQMLYAQGQCMIAICELYAMTQDSMLREPAQRAVNYAESIQSSEGGWRYYPGRDADTSVTGWFLMGLQSARMAGLEVKGETMAKIGYYLDTVQHFDGAAYSYQPNNAPSPAMTAEGLLCRQYLGWQASHPALREAVLTIDEKYPFRMDERNFYYWYYATQVLHHYGGEPWRRWNNVMREELPKSQAKSGREAGSWAPQGSRWGSTGGRLYTTCLSIYCLEVYYRHMPLYKHKN